MYETWRVLRSCKPEHFKDAFNLLLTSSIGGLMPLWGLFILLPLADQPITFYAFTKNGELALYAASFASAALYAIVKEYSRSKKNAAKQKKREFPAKPMFQIVFVVIIAITSIIFSYVTQSNMPNSTASINISYLITASFAVFVASLVFSYVSAVVDSYLTTYDEEDVRNIKKQDLKNFTERFDSLGKE